MWVVEMWDGLKGDYVLVSIHADAVRAGCVAEGLVKRGETDVARTYYLAVNQRVRDVTYTTYSKEGAEVVNDGF